MQRDVVTLAPDLDMVDALQTLLDKRISGAPVVADGKVVGMFSERDCLTAVAAAAYEAEPSGPVGKHMRRDFTSVAPDTDLFRLADLFQGYPIRRLPVVDGSGRLLGLVLRGNVLRALHALYCAKVTPRVEPKTPYERVAQQLEG
jgi:CBS domain-containing protein